MGYLSEANPSLFGERGREAARALTTGFHHLLMVAAALGGIAWTLPRRHRLRELLPFSLAKVREVVSAKTFVQPLLLVALVAWVSHSAGHAEHPFYWLVVVTPLLFWLPLPKAPPRNRTLFFLAGLILLTTVTHAVFFGDDRYHMTISPVLCVLAAAALRRPWGHARRLSQP